MQRLLTTVIASVVAVSALVLGGDERARICQPGFSATIRLDYHSAEYKRLRDATFAAAGVPVSAQCHKEGDKHDPHCYILDHIVPLELDGPNTIDNLQVQRRDVAAAKDLIENEMRRQFCAGKLGLDEARAKIQTGLTRLARSHISRRRNANKARRLRLISRL